MPESTNAFIIDNVYEPPIVEYDLDFGNKASLFGSISEGLLGGTTVNGEVAFGAATPLSSIIGEHFSEPSSAQAEIVAPEELLDEIEWAPRVDKADKIDYIVAVSSGVLSGLVDIFYVGEFSLDRAQEWGTDKVEEVVIRTAQASGYKGDDLKEAIEHLEKHHLAADGCKDPFGGGTQHHFRDFSHHFSPAGLFFSIFTQFTGLAVGTDTAGNLLVVPIPESHKQYLGKNFQEKLAFGTIEWLFHMVSDMAGSSLPNTKGTGIPGPLMSFLKEVSALPFFKDANLGEMDFRLWLSKLFNGTLMADHDEAGRIIKETLRRFDLRMEIGILGELGRQTIPVLINQCIVRGFYFSRRLFREIEQLKINSINDLSRIAPEDILPWGTPAMRRMLTVSTGVFEAVDIADAAVRAIQEENPSTFFLRVNYVGVATFVIACAVDVRATLREKAYANGESPEEAFERQLSDLGCLKLDFQQMRILHSLMHCTVDYDISLEKRDKRRSRKQLWLDEWSQRIVETTSVAWATGTSYFMDEDEFFAEIKSQHYKQSSDSWLWLIAMEALLFKPYFLLHGDNDANYKGLKCSADFIGDVFCTRQYIVTTEGLTTLGKTIKSMQRKLGNSVAKEIVSVTGTVVIIAATGGLAFLFAPAIAPVLAAALGAETAALSGAALTSASLAFLGGGALAAGGMGMAGGAMLIAGGGALIGAAGGSGLSAATSMALASDGSYVKDECAKLVAFCKEVLIAREGDIASVATIYAQLNRLIVQQEAEREAIKHVIPNTEVPSDDDTSNEKDEINPKSMVKILNRSIKYLKRTSRELFKLIEIKGKNPPALPAGN